METPQVGAELNVAEHMTKAVEWVTKWFTQQRKVARLAAEGKELLGISLDPLIAYRHTSSHSHFSGGDPHPDNGNALVTVAGNDLATAKREKRLVTVDDLAVGVGQSAVLIGSPTAEDFSRIVFGYEPTGVENGLRFAHDLVDLPYRWQLDSGEIPAKARRLVRGSGWHERPNWYITGKETHIPYARNADQQLETDFLLLTRIRNFLTPEALTAGRYVFSVAGAHGTGTRAVELVLNDRAVLANVREALISLGSPDWYQLLFRVSNFTHREREGTRARSITLLDAVPIPEDDGMWRQACLEVAPAILRWQLRQASGPST